MEPTSGDELVAGRPSPALSLLVWCRTPTRLRWSGRLAALSVMAVVVSTAHRYIDRVEAAGPALAIAAGHLASAYPVAGGGPHATTFQAPGFPLLAGALTAIWDLFSGAGGSSAAITFTAYLTIAVVVLAGCRLLGVLRATPRQEAVFLAAVATSPFFRESLGIYFHPQDVLALGLVLLSVASGLQSRWVPAGIWLGLAVGCKQWALTAAPVLALMAVADDATCRLLAGGERQIATRRLLLAATGSAAAVYMPFLAASPGSALALLRGPSPVPGGFVPQTTIVGMLREAPVYLPVADVDALARLLPLLGSVVVTGVWAAVRVRRQAGLLTPDPETVVGLLAACLALRLMVDCIALSYYALPLSVMVALVAGWRSRTPAVPVAVNVGLAVWYGTGTGRHLLGPWSGAVVFTALIACVAGLTLRRLYNPVRPAEPLPATSSRPAARGAVP